MVLIPVILIAFALLGVLFVAYLIGAYLWEDRLALNTATLFSVDSDAFLRALHALTGAVPVDGNAVTVLQDGRAFYPAMLDAIHGAHRTVHFETYLFQPGVVARQFVDALCMARARGVEVRVILDAVGSLSEYHPLVEELRASGVDVQYYHPVHWYTLHVLERRTHRKLLITDGTKGFIGGAGVADVWDGEGGDPPWRDLMLACEGPVVQQLQSAFLEHWIALTGDVLIGEGSFPALTPTGTIRAQVIQSSPRAGSTSMRLLYAVAVASARQTIDIASAYFIPDRSALRAFKRAIQRGVRIRVLVPGPVHDVPVARAITRSTYGSLLRRGVEVYEYQPGMMHAKLMIIDDAWATVGSANFDNRSFALNDEVNIALLDPTTASTLRAQYELDLSHAKRLSLDAWHRRSLRMRLEELWAVMLRRQF